jgi:basic membrane protein A and related proteins
MGEQGGSVNVKQKLPWVLTVLVALVFVVAAAACGGGDDEGDDGGAAATGATDTGGGEPVQVGLVTDIGGLNDRGFNELANTGLEQAKSELGVEGRALESKSDADYIPNLSELAESGTDLIITNGFLMGDATHQAAESFPDTNFAIIDFGYGGEGCEETNTCELPNLQGLVFKEQETGCLVGVIAALTSESGTISSVGGQQIPPVDRFIAGYQACAKEANPDIKLLNAYSQEFVATAPCKEIALDQIAKGSDVVFQVAGGCGLGALDAAKEKGVWGIGVDKDQAFLGDHILTSAVKRVDVAVFKAFEAQANGTFEGGSVTVYGLAEDGVGLGEVSPEVPQDVLDKAEEFKARILDGSLELPETVSG